MIVKLKMMIFLFCFLPTLVLAYGPYDANVIDVIDGDTVKVDIDIYPGLVQRINVRLNGVNTAETHSRRLCEKLDGMDAKQFTRSFVLEQGGKVVVDNVRPGKFAGRMLGDIRVGTKDLANALLNAGLAREYHGGKRGPWCED